MSDGVCVDPSLRGGCDSAIGRGPICAAPHRCRLTTLHESHDSVLRCKHDAIGLSLSARSGRPTDRRCSGRSARGRVARVARGPPRPGGRASRTDVSRGDDRRGGCHRHARIRGGGGSGPGCAGAGGGDHPAPEHRTHGGNSAGALPEWGVLVSESTVHAVFLCPKCHWNSAGTGVLPEHLGFPQQRELWGHREFLHRGRDGAGLLVWGGGAPDLGAAQGVHLNAPGQSAPCRWGCIRGCSGGGRQ